MDPQDYEEGGTEDAEFNQFFEDARHSMAVGEEEEQKTIEQALSPSKLEI